MSKSKFWLRGRKILRSPIFWGGLLLAAGCFIRLGREIQTIRATPITSWEIDSSADCALVLTGGIGRVREGLDLLADHRVKKLIISGVHPDAHLREILPSWTFHGSLREDDIILERRSETTWGNAQQSLPIVEALHCRDILLITSRIHMHRAFKTFRAVFPDSIEIQTQSVVGTRFEPVFTETLVEAFKALFYSVWAY